MSTKPKRGRPRKIKKDEVVEQRRWLVDLVKSTFKMFSAGRDFLVSVAGVITAIVALSGSCNNFKRADTSYTALASKINQVLVRLETLERAHDIVVKNDSKPWSERVLDVLPKDEEMGVARAMAKAVRPPVPVQAAAPLPLKLDELIVQQEQHMPVMQAAPAM